MAPDEVVAYLCSLPELWADPGPEGHQALASALFTKLEVEGYTKMRYELTPDAVTLGLGAAPIAKVAAGLQALAAMLAALAPAEPKDGLVDPDDVPEHPTRR